MMRSEAEFRHAIEQIRVSQSCAKVVKEDRSFEDAQLAMDVLEWATGSDGHFAAYLSACDQIDHAFDSLDEAMALRKIVNEVKANAG